MKKLLKIPFIFILSCTLFSCATSIPMNVLRPAELDLGGAEYICVIPFRTSDYVFYPAVGNRLSITIGSSQKVRNKAEKNIADYITSGLVSKLSHSQYFKLVSATAVETALRYGNKAPVDVYLTGNIDNFTNDIVTVKRKVEVDGKEVIKTYYSRKVGVSISYQVVDASNNTIISYKNKNIGLESSENLKVNDLPDPIDLIDYQLDSLINQISNELQPYYVTITIKLLKDKTKNPKMKYADELANDGLIEEARQTFMEVYLAIHQFEAGYNAAQLSVVLGDLEKAYSLMVELVGDTQDKRARTALRDIRNEINLAKKLKEQQRARQ